MRVHRRLLPSGQPIVSPTGVPVMVRGFAWFSRRLERRPRLAVSLGLVLVAVVAAVDVLTGPELNLSILYLVPISLVAAVASTAVTFPVAAAAVAVCDEFAVVPPETPAEAARAATGQILERLRDVTAGAEVGATAGVVTVKSGHIAVAALMADADRLLYQAKRAEKGTFKHAVVPDGRSSHGRLARSPVTGGH